MADPIIMAALLIETLQRPTVALVQPMQQFTAALLGPCFE
jgi:hypothetical protein